MKTLNSKLLIILTSLLLLLSGCASTPEPRLEEDLALALTNTKWHYTDSEKLAYQIEFLPDGLIRTKHPNERTAGDDSWQQSGKTVRIYFNNKYSVLQGEISDRNMMTGTAQNKENIMWEWKAVRVE